ncbi:branched-chain amino acid transport system II carrier protein [Sharpea azabuensis]|uniref:branched-chain amino acid transport system II carrier protein n=1 Tax=Sharpea azabuensis TaxID=322505 RepID=UPI003C6F354F
MFTLSSFFISILGLYNILSFSVYILNVLYPVAIGLMILGFVRKKKDNEKC